MVHNKRPMADYCEHYNKKYGSHKELEIYWPAERFFTYLTTISDNALELIWKQAVMKCFEVIPHHLPRVLRKIAKKTQEETMM
jgi:glycerol-3-phosphate responsive antiterminator